MLPSGIFVSTQLDYLLSNLPDRLVQNGPSRLAVEVDPDGPCAEEQPVLRIAQWSDKWLFIEPSGPRELTTLVVESLVGKDPVSELLSCHYKPDEGEYSYALFREGILLETFETIGPTLENVNFTSELRKVSLQELLKASDFMVESISQFGIEPGPLPPMEVGETLIHVHFPTKRTFWQALLGAASSK